MIQGSFPTLRSVGPGCPVEVSSSSCRPSRSYPPSSSPRSRFLRSQRGLVRGLSWLLASSSQAGCAGCPFGRFSCDPLSVLPPGSLPPQSWHRLQSTSLSLRPRSASDRAPPSVAPLCPCSPVLSLLNPNRNPTTCLAGYMGGCSVVRFGRLPCRSLFPLATFASGRGTCHLCLTVVHATPQRCLPMGVGEEASSPALLGSS